MTTANRSSRKGLSALPPQRSAVINKHYEYTQAQMLVLSWSCVLSASAVAGTRHWQRTLVAVKRSFHLVQVRCPVGACFVLLSKVASCLRTDIWPNRQVDIYVN